MSITFKRMLSVALIALMMVVFMPFAGNYTAFASNGEEENVEWVKDAIMDLWTIDGTDVAMSSYILSMDDRIVRTQLGYDDEPEKMDECRAYWQIKSPGSESWEELESTVLNGDEDGLFMIPEDIEEDCLLRVRVNDGNTDWDYYSPEIKILTRKVSNLNSMGDLFLEFKDGKAALDDVDISALINTLRISEYQGNIYLEGMYNPYIDINMDGVDDICLDIYNDDTTDDPEYVPEESPLVAELLSDLVASQTDGVNIAPNANGYFDIYDGENPIYASSISYYDSITFYASAEVGVVEIKNIKDAKFTLAATKLVYSGKDQRPSVTVKYDGEKLKAGQDYTVKGSRKSVGKGTVTITGKGSFTGTKKLTFKVIPKGTKITDLKASKKAFTVKWKKQSSKMSKNRIGYYQIQYARNSKFTSGKKTVTVKGYKATSKKIKGLKKGKTYYVRVRTYMKVDGKKYYSKWSAAKKVKTK